MHSSNSSIFPTHSSRNSILKHPTTTIYTDLFLFCKTPMVAKTSIESNKNTKPPDPHAYWSIVGMLVYLTITQPNIIFVGNQLSQKMSEPTLQDMESFNWLLWYIKNSFSLGLLFGSTTSGFDLDEAILAYSVSDWVVFPATRHSITSYGAYLGSSLTSH